MKKLLIIIGLFGMILNSHGQRDVWNGSFDLANLGGTDTVLYKYLLDTNRAGTVQASLTGFGSYWGIEFEAKTISSLCADAIIDIGFSQDAATFTSYSTVTGGSTVFPYTIAPGDSAAVNGTQKLTRGDESPVHPYQYYAIKITKGSCSTGVLTWKLTQN
jgi:hypothetical protein